MKVSLTTPFLMLSLALLSEASPLNDKQWGKATKKPSYFTSAFFARATPDTIVVANGTRPAGQQGALGRYSFYINSDEEKICWDIILQGVTGEYRSMARTATHVHQAPAGSAGPPRLAFPNPTFEKTLNGSEIRRSEGCLAGPFQTGIQANNVDTGSASGFRLAAIEADPAGFFADVHTGAFVDGAVRGQLLRSERPVRRPRTFTSVLRAEATPDEVVSGTGTPNAGQPGARGKFELRLNTHDDVLCYDIELRGVEGDYLSPAKTATHVHQAARGANGPPRLALPNPRPKWYARWRGKHARRTASGCIQGPFTTGLLANGQDSGSASGFSLAQLEQNPEGFFADSHTVAFSAGAVRGQLKRVK